MTKKKCSNCEIMKPLLPFAKKISDVYRTKYQKNVLEITTGQDDSRSITPKPVKYSIEKIAEAGFTLKDDMISEIERTMHVCEGFIE